MESYISPNKKGIIALPEINESSTQRFVDAPTRHITLINIILAKMEKHEKKWISQTITSNTASL
jgi:hypothetical protein